MITILFYLFIMIFSPLCIIFALIVIGNAMFAKEIIPLTMKEEQDKMWKQLQKYMKEQCEREDEGDESWKS